MSSDQLRDSELDVLTPTTDGVKGRNPIVLPAPEPIQPWTGPCVVDDMSRGVQMAKCDGSSAERFVVDDDRE